MKRRPGVLAAVALSALLALAVVWHFRGGKSPEGQHSLVSLTSNNFGELRSAFNAAPGEVRVVLLLSPT